MAVPVALPERKGAKAARLEAAVAELKHELADYARTHGGRFILFGSAARREMRPDSDVDILVDFPSGAESAAAEFAESASRRRGLRPDFIGYSWPDGRIGARIGVEGLVLPGDEERWSRPLSMEDRLGDILDAAQAAVTHFGAAERLFARGGLENQGDAALERQMAFLHFMQMGHTALEDALVRAVKALGEAPPAGSDWHQQVIERAAMAASRRRPILSPDLAAAASETRKSRHFAARAYIVNFDAEKARPGVEAARIIIERFEGAIRDFVDRFERG